jgi:hypothetical protein
MSVSSITSSIMSGLSRGEIMAIGEILRLKQSTTSVSSDTQLSLVDDYTSSDDEDETDHTNMTCLKHDHCRSNHRQSTCLDDRCKGRKRCHHECQGCPHMPENKQKKEQLTKEKNKEKAEKALALKAQRIEKYGKMLEDAAAYKAKWNL